MNLGELVVLLKKYPKNSNFYFDQNQIVILGPKGFVASVSGEGALEEVANG
jgi:hypothetical protein